MENNSSLLNDKVVLVVDDEPDILDLVEELLEMCIVHKSRDFDTGLQYLMSYSYDIVILDIMGVNGFELLKTSVKRGFPTIMLTAHALSPESLKKSIKLGAVSFLPKDRINELQDFLEVTVLGHGKSIWLKFFEKFDKYLSRQFGHDWKERDRFFKEFEESLRSEKNIDQSKISQ